MHFAVESALSLFKTMAQQLNLPITDRSYLPFIYQLAPDNTGVITFFSGQLDNFIAQPTTDETASTVPLLGVQGGVGTEAGVDFIHNIISLYPQIAVQNQNNPNERPFNIALLSNSATPDRSTKIDHLYDDSVADPGKALFGGIKMLFALGAEISCVACNTAHYWLSEADVQKKLSADANKQMSIITALIEHLTSPAVPQLSTDTQGVIMLATRDTLQTGLYQRALRTQGIHVKDLSSTEVDIVHDAIYQDIKAGFPQRALAPLMTIAERYPQHILILCCTELGLVLNAENTPELFQSERLVDNNIISPTTLIRKLLAVQGQAVT